jgi:hypothetical protein
MARSPTGGRTQTATRPSGTSGWRLERASSRSRTAGASKAASISMISTARTSSGRSRTEPASKPLGCGSRGRFRRSPRLASWFGVLQLYDTGYDLEEPGRRAGGRSTVFLRASDCAGGRARRGAMREVRPRDARTDQDMAWRQLLRGRATASGLIGGPKCKPFANGRSRKPRNRDHSSQPR